MYIRKFLQLSTTLYMAEEVTPQGIIKLMYLSPSPPHWLLTPFRFCYDISPRAFLFPDYILRSAQPSYAAPYVFSRYPDWRIAFPLLAQPRLSPDLPPTAFFISLLVHDVITPYFWYDFIHQAVAILLSRKRGGADNRAFARSPARRLSRRTNVLILIIGFVPIFYADSRGPRSCASCLTDFSFSLHYCSRASAIAEVARWGITFVCIRIATAPGVANCYVQSFTLRFGIKIAVRCERVYSDQIFRQGRLFVYSPRDLTFY